MIASVQKVPYLRHSAITAKSSGPRGHRQRPECRGYDTYKERYLSETRASSSEMCRRIKNKYQNGGKSDRTCPHSGVCEYMVL